MNDRAAPASTADFMRLMNSDVEVVIADWRKGMILVVLLASQVRWT
ncbi:hypothetical protein [Paraburkholderia sp. BR14374]